MKANLLCIILFIATLIYNPLLTIFVFFACGTISLLFLDELKSQLDKELASEHLKWNARARAGGSGLAVNLKTGKRGNAYSPDECSNRAKYYNGISETRKNLAIFTMWLFSTISISGLIAFVLYCFCVILLQHK